MRVDDKTIMSEINPEPKVLTGVKVRLTSPKYLSFPGIIYKGRFVSRTICKNIMRAGRTLFCKTA